MKIFFGSKDAGKELKRPVVAVGVFDGVHLGHQRLMRELKSWAKETGGNSVLITFDRHPKNVLEGKPPCFITSLRHRLRLFEKNDIDACVVLKFDAHLAQMTAEQFIGEILKKDIGAVGLLMGFNSSIGRGKEGNLNYLTQRQAEIGLEVRGVEPVIVDGEPVSSTAIRAAITAGEIERAEKMLGRRYSILGTVVKGVGVGSRLGFPTANLDLHHELFPSEGVYASVALLNDGAYPSVLSIGTRPTFRSDSRNGGKVVVEVHIINWRGNLYGRDIEARLRSSSGCETNVSSPQPPRSQRK